MPSRPGLRVAIRADASAQMGTGHLRRCRSLALALAERRCDVRFFSRDLGLDTAALIEPDFQHANLLAPGSEALAMEKGAPPHADWAGVTSARDSADMANAFVGANWIPDWIIVDHYAFAAEWHQALRTATGARIAAVDDLGDRALAVDLLIDHNWHTDHRAKYCGRINPGTRLSVGPRFALLDPAYAAAPRYSFHETVRSIGIFMGGTDAGNTSGRVLDAVSAARFGGAIEVVTTSANPNLATLQAHCAALSNCILSVDIANLASFFARHDLHVGAGGGATWERFCIGAPSILLSFATNHDEVLEPLRAEGLAHVLEQNWTDAQLSATIAELIADKAKRSDYAKRGRTLVDGQGCARVADTLVGWS